MIAERSVSLIIPGYNEVGRIAETVRNAHAYFESRGVPHEIIAAVEGNDGTIELVESLVRTYPYVRAITHEGRRGKGHAIRTAVAQATGDIIGFIDADNKTPIEEFDQVGAVFDTGADLVIGSRRAAGTRIERPQPWYRRIGARAFAVFMHAVVGLHDVPDTQCGFKFFRRDVARDLFARQRIDGYMFDIEILCLAAEAGYRLTQIPIRWRDDGDSRLDLLRGNLRNVADVMRIRRGIRGRARAAGKERSMYAGR